MTRRDRTLDRATQAWVRATGRLVDLEEHPWLRGPVGSPDIIADTWLRRPPDAFDTATEVRNGVLDSFAALRGDRFDPSRVHPAVVRFYECTSAHRLDVSMQWSPIALPFGWVISTVFARRLQQLALPLRRHDVARGIDSRVVAYGDDETAWLRTLRATGQTFIAGCYRIMTIPGAASPSVRVVFPLPNGSMTVFLRPSNTGGGALTLSSPLGRFGEHGAYLLVKAGDASHVRVRRVPIVETIDVYADEDDVLRAHHDIRLYQLSAVTLRYRIDDLGARRGSGPAGPLVR